MNPLDRARQRPERELRNAIIQLLRVRYQIPAWPVGVGALPATYRGATRFVRLGTPGMADILAVAPSSCGCGRFLAIEVKSPTGRVRPEQQMFLDIVNAAGGLGFVARSLDDVITALEIMRA